MAGDEAAAAAGRELVMGFQSEYTARGFDADILGNTHIQTHTPARGFDTDVDTHVLLLISLSLSLSLPPSLPPS